MTKTSDRRKGPRRKLVLEVTYLDPGDAAPDYVINLTREGVFIATNQPFTVGQRITLNLGRKVTGLNGVVRWRQTPTPTQTGGIGVEFIYVDEAHAREIGPKLDRLIARLAIVDA